MALQAFVDDSVSDGEVLVLGGYISSAERWAKFSAEWQFLLDTAPAWKRFKMKDANYRRFNPAVLERTKQHFEVIKRHVWVEIRVAIAIPAFKLVCDEFSIPSPLRNPYYLAWNEIVKMCMFIARKRRFREPIEFFFDEQTEKAKVLQAWDEAFPQYHYRLRKLLAGTPTFGSDDDLLPLQAADFAAWWTRRNYLEQGGILQNGPLVPWETNAPSYNRLSKEVNYRAIHHVISTNRSPRMGYTIEWKIPSSPCI